jgi:hypothetical protein
MSVWILYAEFEEPPLAICQQILLCRYTKNPECSCGATPRCSLQVRYALSTKASHSSGKRYKQLLAAINITTTLIIPHKVPIIPPWGTVVQHCTTHLCNYKKACTFSDIFHRVLSEIFSCCTRKTLLMASDKWINKINCVTARQICSVIRL